MGNANPFSNNLKKKKFIADQYEMTLGRVFIASDKVVVTPLVNDPNLVKPIFAEIISVNDRNINGKPIDPFLIVKDEADGQLYSVFVRQCILRK